jgi:hypothetical protein
MARTFGRLNGQWNVVETDENGYNDQVMLTTLAQNLKLNLGESPFYADKGIPAISSVQTAIAPTMYMARIQQYFAPYFANLTIAQVPGQVNPTYNVFVLTNSGASSFFVVAL